MCIYSYGAALSVYNPMEHQSVYILMEQKSLFILMEQQSVYKKERNTLFTLSKTCS